MVPIFSKRVAFKRLHIAQGAYGNFDIFLDHVARIPQLCAALQLKLRTRQRGLTGHALLWRPWPSDADWAPLAILCCVQIVHKLGARSRHPGQPEHPDHHSNTDGFDPVGSEDASFEDSFYEGIQKSSRFGR